MLISLLKFDFIWFIIQMSGLIMLYLIMIDLNCMSPLKTSHPTGEKLVNLGAFNLADEILKFPDITEPAQHRTAT